MQRQRREDWVEARAVLRRSPTECLIVRRFNDPAEPWELPGQRVTACESAEVTIRRACLEKLGLEPAEFLPQPMLTHGRGTQGVNFHYFVGDVRHDDALPLGYAAIRWVLLSELDDYALDTPDRHILDRLRETGQGT